MTRQQFEEKLGRKITDNQWKDVEFYHYCKMCGDYRGSIEQIAEKFGISVNKAKTKIMNMAKKGYAMPYNIRGFQR
jgi:hypothetical protein